MHILLTLTLLLGVPLALWLAFLILSSCLGEQIRARLRRTSQPSRSSSTTASYGKTYARNIFTGGGLSATGGGYEQIEMDEMLARADE